MRDESCFPFLNLFTLHSSLFTHDGRIVFSPCAGLQQAGKLEVIGKQNTRAYVPVGEVFGVNSWAVRKRWRKPFKGLKVSKAFVIVLIRPKDILPSALLLSLGRNPLWGLKWTWDSFGTLKAPSSQPTLMLRVGARAKIKIVYSVNGKVCGENIYKGMYAFVGYKYLSLKKRSRGIIDCEKINKSLGFLQLG